MRYACAREGLIAGDNLLTLYKMSQYQLVSPFLLCINYNWGHIYNTYSIVFNACSDSARYALVSGHCPFISQIVLKNFIKICLIIEERPEEILIKLAIVLKISKSSWNTVHVPCFKSRDLFFLLFGKFFLLFIHVRLFLDFVLFCGFAFRKITLNMKKLKKLKYNCSKYKAT
jgi:hypothetical protein